MRKIHEPPEGYSTATGKGEAWCPYCGEPKLFVYDSYLGTVRCGTCGISTEDYHVRKYNGFFSYTEDGKKRTAKDRFEDAVKASGLKWPRKNKPDWYDRSQDTELPAWEPPPASESGAIHCPECGKYVRHGYYPVVNLRCEKCNTVFSADGPGRGVKTAKRKEGHYCPECGNLLTTDPAEGAAYWCPDCCAWSAPGDSPKAKKALREAQASRLRVERVGQLPGAVVNKVKALAAAECANYEKGACCVGDKPCVFYVDGGHRCRWFEEAVLPLKPELVEPYRRIYDEAETKQAAEARKALKDAKEQNLKKCAREGCEKPFMPRNNFDRYCSEICKKMVRKEADRERKKKFQDNGVMIPQRGIFSSPASQ